jgi:tetratricopeptide (TPR) repeat protein
MEIRHHTLLPSALSKGGSVVKLVLICVALAFIILAVYMQAGNHQFLIYDDGVYVKNNPHVTSGITGKNIIWAFTSTDAANWHPITWLSHMADAQLYGMDPRGHHLTNVVIHTVSSVLLLLLLFRLTGSLWQSSFVAALFALHPLHVESVAWVAERKDVLCGFFWFLTLLFYSEYVAKRKPTLYFLSLFSFMLGLMSKPMLVTLPLVMLLIDFWPLNRYRFGEQGLEVCQLPGGVTVLIKEKVPFFVSSFISGIVTIYAQGKGEALNVISFRLSVENALITYEKYILKTLWPYDLAVLYPLSSSLPLWQAISSLLILLLVSAAVFWLGSRCPYLPVGWFWFLVTLLPVIGLIQVGVQAMADRYTYIPLIGLFIMVAWGVPDLIKGLRRRKVILALLSVATITASAVLTWQQLGYWRDDVSLYRHTLRVTSGNYVIHNNLGVALYSKGDLDAAIQEYREALRISPNYSDAHNNLGLALARKGYFDEAIQEYQEALRTSPNHTHAHNNLGLAFVRKGDLDAAIREYQEALRISPNYTHAHYNLGLALASKGNLDAAMQEYREAFRIDPNYPDAHYNLGLAFGIKGKLDAAIREFQEELRINPDNTKVQNNLGIALAQKRRQDEYRK